MSDKKKTMNKNKIYVQYLLLHCITLCALRKHCENLKFLIYLLFIITLLYTFFYKLSLFLTSNLLGINWSLHIEKLIFSWEGFLYYIVYSIFKFNLRLHRPLYFKHLCIYAKHFRCRSNVWQILSGVHYLGGI